MNWKSVLLTCVAMSLTGCGGHNDTPHVTKADDVTACRQQNLGFINHTALTMDQVWSQWRAAQNAVGVVGVLEDALASHPHKTVVDGRALSTGPNCTIVETKPDVLVSELVKRDARWVRHKDPTCVILKGDETVHSYVDFGTNPYTIVSAASCVDTALEYEMENQLLHVLGYSTEQR